MRISRSRLTISESSKSEKLAIVASRSGLTTPLVQLQAASQGKRYGVSVEYRTQRTASSQTSAGLLAFSKHSHHKLTCSTCSLFLHGVKRKFKWWITVIWAQMANLTANSKITVKVGSSLSPTSKALAKKKLDRMFTICPSPSMKVQSSMESPGASLRLERCESSSRPLSFG